ncbi:MAG: formylglycine-generating enzyme family protein [Limisphaerales bacterium]
MLLFRVIIIALCALLSSSAQVGDAVPYNSAQAGNPPQAPRDMAGIPAGIYEPAFRQPTEPASVPVSAFLIDIFPVTNADFLEFVRARPEWTRSQVKRLFADDQYLIHWSSDLELGPTVNSHAPVTRVSWFAARAYARWKGRRLPTTAEWEYVAQASSTNANAARDPAFRGKLHALYATPMPSELPSVGAGAPNYFGVHDLHGLAWEWVADFSTAMVTGDARGDTGLDRQLFCGSGAQGAKDIGDFPAFMRFAFRSSLKASYTVPNLGFRCAQDL